MYILGEANTKYFKYCIFNLELVKVHPSKLILNTVYTQFPIECI